MLLSSLGTSVANVALPTLEETFDASFGQVQWVVLAYLLAVTTLVVSAGRLGDLVGRRRLLAGGIVTFTLASALAATAPTLWALTSARALQGVGAAAMMALTLAFVSGSVPRERTGSAMGLLGSMSAVGTALGPTVGGALIAGPGWRAIFLLNVPFGLLAVYLAHRHLPADRPDPAAARPRFDAVGTVLLALTLGAYALAMTLINGHLRSLAVVLAFAAAVAGVLFVFVERRVAAPLVSATILRDRVLNVGFATSGLVSTVMMATLVVGPFYLVRALHLGPALVGLVMSVGPGIVALSGVPAGRIADRLGGHRVTVGGLTLMAGGTGLLAVTPVRLGVIGYIAPMIVVTLGYGLFQTANNTVVMNVARPDQRGVVSGMLNLSRNLGLITGASLMGAVFALAAGTTSVANAPVASVATGLHVTFGVATTIIAAAIVLSAASRSRVRVAHAPH